MGELNLAEAHVALAAVIGGRDCIVWRDRRISWHDFTDRTRRLAAILGNGRVRPEGEPWESPHAHLGLFLTNGNEYLEGMLGAAKAAWAAININYRYVADELAYVLDDAAVDAVLYHGRFAATLGEVLPRLRHPTLHPAAGSTTAAMTTCCPERSTTRRRSPPPAPIAWPPPWPLSPDDRYVALHGRHHRPPEGGGLAPG